MKIFEILKARQVQRLHCFNVHNRQNLADHQWGVAMWVLYIMQGSPWKHVHEAMLYALMHDLGETLVGDVPSPTKRMMPDKGASIEVIENQHIKAIYGLLPDIGDHIVYVKIADYLDLMHYCVCEHNMGNNTLDDVFTRAVEYLVREVGHYENPWIQTAADELIRAYHERTPPCLKP